MNTLNEERKGFESLGNSYASETSTLIERVVIAGVTCYWFRPKETEGDESIIYLHGGAFIYGSIKSHGAMVSHIARAIRRTILFIEYSLAPELPFPKALHETGAVVEALLKAKPDFEYGIMGDSAGGNLAMSTTLYLKARGAKLPLYQIFISPWLNPDPIYASYIHHEKLDPIITKAFINYAASLYADMKNFKNPLVSPLHGEFEDLPPTLIMVGMLEVLRDDSLHLYTSLQQAGSPAYLKIYHDATHVWMLTDITSKVAIDALGDIGQFLDGIFASIARR